MRPAPISVVLVGSPQLRAGLRELIGAAGMHLAGEADDGRHPLPPADLALVEPDAVAALEGADRRILVISSAPSEEEFLEAMLAGACGYLPLPAATSELRTTLLEAAAGTTVVPRRFQATLVQALRTL